MIPPADNPPGDAGTRDAGALLHITSLPSPGGSGDLGDAAHAFIDRLARMGLSWWQTLPVGPVGRGFSPYSARSSFAGAEHLVAPEPLIRAGYLDADAARDMKPAGVRADPRAVRRRIALVRHAATRFDARADRATRERFSGFIESNNNWLDDYALYEAVSRAEGTGDWTRWPAPIRRRDGAALREAADSLRDETHLERVVQFLFDEQWRALRAGAADAGVRLMGDLPFYPSLESADVWANQSQFDLDDAGRPNAVAAVPPDYFSDTGQVWDAPLYRWPAHERDGFAYLAARVRRSGELFDALRLDHFIGFHRAWAVDPDARTAEHGVWREAPGESALNAVRAATPGLLIIAEDLGVLTDRAAALRDLFGLPGMRVLQFAFDDDNPGAIHRPSNHPVNCVAYTGTHDNNTTRGWAEELLLTPAGRAVLARACAYLNVTEAQLPAAMLRAALESPARTAIIPVQDILDLGAEARMNTPGEARGMWRWRVDSFDVIDRAAEAFRARVEHAGRAGEW